jgi:hypothetical protein
LIAEKTAVEEEGIGKNRVFYDLEYARERSREEEEEEEEEESEEMCGYSNSGDISRSKVTSPPSLQIRLLAAREVFRTGIAKARAVLARLTKDAISMRFERGAYMWREISLF